MLQLTHQGMTTSRTESAALLTAVISIKDVLGGHRGENGGQSVDPGGEASDQQSMEQSAPAAADRPGLQTNSSRLTTDKRRAPSLPNNQASPLTELPQVVNADRQDSLHSMCVFMSGNKDDVSDNKLKLFPRAESKAVLQENRPTAYSVVKQSQLSTTGKKVAVVPVCMLKTGVLHARRQTMIGQVRKGSTLKKI